MTDCPLIATIAANLGLTPKGRFGRFVFEREAGSRQFIRKRMKKKVIRGDEPKHIASDSASPSSCRALFKN